MSSGLALLLWYSSVSTFLNQSGSPTFGKLAQKNVQVYK